MSIVLFFAFLGLVILRIKKSVNSNLTILLIPCMIILLPIGILYGARHQYLVKEKKLMKTYLKEAYGEDFKIIKMKRLLMFFNDAPSTSAVAVLARDKNVRFPISRRDIDILKNGKPDYNSKSYLISLWGSQCKQILKDNLNAIKPNLIKADILSKTSMRKEEENLIKDTKKAIDLIAALKKYPNEIKIQVTLFILTDKTDIESLEKTTYLIIKDLKNKDNLNIYLRVIFIKNSLVNKINIFKTRNTFDSGLKMYEEKFQNTEVVKRYVIESIDEVESIKELEKYIDTKVYFKKTD